MREPDPASFGKVEELSPPKFSTSHTAVREQETPDGDLNTAGPLWSILGDNGLAYGSR